jgi:hypothetical protein
MSHDMFRLTNNHHLNRVISFPCIKVEFLNNNIKFVIIKIWIRLHKYKTFACIKNIRTDFNILGPILKIEKRNILIIVLNYNYFFCQLFDHRKIQMYLKVKLQLKGTDRSSRDDDYNDNDNDNDNDNYNYNDNDTGNDKDDPTVCPFFNHNVTIVRSFDIKKCDYPPEKWLKNLPKSSSLIEEKRVTVNLPSNKIVCLCADHSTPLALEVKSAKLTHKKKNKVKYSTIDKDENPWTTDDVKTVDSTDDIAKVVPFDEITDNTSVTFKLHWYCWCTTPGVKNPCGCGCDSDHDGW